MLLNTFDVVVRNGSVHGAARELRINQTAITKRIQLLEQGLGLSLFTRSRKGMVLTAEGEILGQFSKSIHELEGQFLSRIEGDSRKEVSVTIIGPTSTISTRVAENCENLYQKFPFLNLNLRSDDHSNLVEIVKSGKADFAIVPPELVPNEMDSKVLKPEKYFLVASSEWKGRRLEDILENEKIIDFYESDMTTRKYLQKFGLLALMKKSRLFVNENEALIKYFIKGIGFGTLTESVAEPFLKSKNLITLNRGQAMEEPLALVWYPRTQKTKYIEAIIRSLK